MTKEIRDQLAHAGAAILCLLPVALAPNIFTGMVSGFLCGMIREVTEEGEISLAAVRHALGSWKDLCGWSLGGLIVGLLA